MGNYEPLGEFLIVQKYERVQISFDEIEKLGVKLPPSAKKHRAWRSNSRSTGLKVHMDAGYQTQNVDMESRRLTFVRVSKNTCTTSQSQENGINENQEALLHQRIEDMELKLLSIQSDLKERDIEIEAQQAIIESQANRLAEKVDKFQAGLIFAAFAAGALIFGLF